MFYKMLLRILLKLSGLLTLDTIRKDPIQKKSHVELESRVEFLPGINLPLVAHALTSVTES